jgi:GntR family transcriptional regulator, frlABCD operon transcriptional regulator
MTTGYDNVSPLYDQVKRLILGGLKIGHCRSWTYPHSRRICADSLE